MFATLLSWSPVNTNTAQAAIAKYLNFQGKLTKVSDGTNVANGSYAFEFKLYDASTSGTLLWTETYDQPSGACTKLVVTSGVFNAKLGSCNALTSVDFTSSSLYLSVNFAPTGTSYDGEMSPRKQLVSTAYAFIANGVSGDGPVNNTISSATALTVAKAGSNYGLQVDTSAGSAATGLKITSAAAASGIALAAISSGTNENLTLDAKGSGTVSIGATSTGDILLGGGSGSSGCTVTNSSGAFACTAGGSFTTMALTGAITGATSYNGLVVTANTGVITTGTWQGTAVGSQYGGTGQNFSASSGLPSINSGTWQANAITQNGVAYGGASNAMSFTAQGAANTVLVANAGAPSFSAAITVGTSVTSPTINATSAVQTGGTQRLDSAGALSNITGYTQTSGNFSIAGAGTFGTGTGAISLNGNTTIASGKTLDVSPTGSGKVTITNATASNSAGVLDLQVTSSSNFVPALNLSMTQTATGSNTSYGLSNNSASSAVVTGASVGQTMYGLYNSVSKSGADTATGTTNTYGTYNLVTNTGRTNVGTVNAYGGYFDAAGDTAGTSTIYGIYTTAAGGDTNYGLYSAAGQNYFAGNVGIGDTSPTAALTVGSGDLFQVNSSGAIAAATGIASSGAINFSTLSASSAVYTDGSKNLTSTAPTSGTIGYWSRSGTTLSTATGGDAVTTSGNISTSGSGTITSAGTMTASNGLTLTTGALSLTGTSGSTAITGYGTTSITSTTTTGNINTFANSSLAPAASATGYLLNLTVTNGSVNTTGTSTVAGINIAPTTTAAGAGGTMETYGVRIQNAAGTAGAGTQNIYGIRIGNQGAGTNTETTYGLYVDAQTGGGTASYGAVFAGGNVGIGDTTPTGLLTLSGGNIILEEGNTGREITFAGGRARICMYCEGAGNDFNITTSNGRAIQFHTDAALTGDPASLDMIIGATGLVGIGDATPDQKLEVMTSSATATQITVSNSSTGDAQVGFEFSDGTNNFTMGIDNSVTGDPFKISTTSLGTNDIVILDSRTTTSGVSTITLQGIAPTIASAATAEYTTLTATAPGIILTGSTSVTTAMDSFIFTAPTIADNDATQIAITDANTVTISSAPIATGSTGTAITNSVGLRISTADLTTGSGAVTNGYGIYVDPPTGATANYAAVFTSGNVGIGTTTPTAFLHVGSNGAASNPGLKLSGSWFTGGDSTTTKPQLLVEASGATSSGWSTSGTGVGINAPSGFAGRMLDAKLNGTTAFSLNEAGGISTIGQGITNFSATSGYWYQPAATVSVGNNGDSGASNLLLRAGTSGSSGGNITFSINNSNAGIWNSSGLGIGTGTPIDPLSISTPINASATHALFNLSNTALVSGSGNGTYIGANPTSFTGNFFDFQVANTSVAKLTSGGALTVTSCTGCGSGATAFDAIGDPSGNGAINMGTTVQTLDWGATTTTDNLSITSSATGLTSGSAFKVTSATTGAITNGIVQLTASGAYTGSGGLLNVTGNATTGGIIENISGTGITTGTITNITAGTGITSGAALKVSASGTSAIANGLVQISHSGAYTSTGGLLNVASSASTAGTLVNLTNNTASFTGTALNISTTGITSGTGIQVVGGGSMAGGQLMGLVMGTASTGTALNISANGGAYTGTGLLAFNSNSLTSGTMLSIAANGASQTSAKYIDIAQTGTTTGFTGSLINLSSSSTTGAATFINLAANASTVGIGQAISMTALTTGSALSLAGPTTTGVITGTSSGFLKVVSDVGSGSTAGVLAYFAPDYSGSTSTGYGIKIDGTDSTGTNKTNYNLQSNLTMTGNGGKTGYGLYSNVTSDSTSNSYALYGGYFSANATGAISANTRDIYGIYSAPSSSTGASTGGTTNIYGGYFLPTSSDSTTGSTVNSYGIFAQANGRLTTGGTLNSYGLYVANSNTHSTGTTNKYGIYVEQPTTADNNYAAIFAGGNVGIGTTTPGEELNLGDGSNLLLDSGYMYSPQGGFGRNENRLKYTEEFDNAAWTKTTGVTVTANSVAGPTGYTRADTLGAGDDSADNVSQPDWLTTATASTTWTGSVWLKKSSGSGTVNLKINSTNETGTSNPVTVTTSWQRFTVTQTFTSGSTGTATFLINHGTTAYYAWGAQMEKQSTAGIYVRNARRGTTGASNGLVVNANESTGGSESTSSTAFTLNFDGADDSGNYTTGLYLREMRSTGYAGYHLRTFNEAYDTYGSIHTENVSGLDFSTGGVSTGARYRFRDVSTTFATLSNNTNMPGLDLTRSAKIKGTATSVLTGTIDPIASTAVTGVGTLFTTELTIGDRITVSGETRTVTAITNDTSLTVDTAFSNNANDTTPDKLAAILSTVDSSNNPGLVVQDDGRVGIGTAAPSTLTQLDVVKNQNTYTLSRIYNANSGSSASARLILGNDTAPFNGQIIQSSSTETTFGGANSLNLYNSANASIAFFTNGANERLRVAGDGTVSIGTTGTKGLLTIARTDAANDEAIYIDTEESTTTQQVFAIESDTSTADTVKMYITAEGEIKAKLNTQVDPMCETSGVIGSCTSDGRLKTNVVDLEDGVLDKIMQIKPRYFDWLNGSGEHQPGFIAQEVQSILPATFRGYTGDGYLKFSKDVVIPYLTKALQELNQISIKTTADGTISRDSFVFEMPENQANIAQVEGLGSQAVASTGFIINQKGSGNIIQLQQGGIDKLLIANDGSLHISTNMASGLVMEVKNADTTLLTINTRGTAILTGTLVVKKDVAVLGTVLGSTSVIAKNTSNSPIRQGDVVYLTGATDAVFGDQPTITVAAATEKEKDKTIVGIADRNLSDFNLDEAAPVSADPTVTNPGEYLNVVITGTFKKVSVTAVNTSVSTGDKLTLSTTAGSLRKLNTGETLPAIGIALDNLTSGTGTVRVLLVPTTTNTTIQNIITTPTPVVEPPTNNTPPVTENTEVSTPTEPEPLAEDPAPPTPLP